MNCTAKTSFWPESCYSKTETVVVSTISALVMVMITGGNLLVVIAVFHNVKLRRCRQNWLIVSLAVSDFLVGLLVMPLSLAYELRGEWLWGLVLCELWLALDVLFVTASILNLCAISLDRFWAVTKPLQYPKQRTAGRMSLFILVVWMTSFVVCFPPLVGWRPIRVPGQCVLSTDIGYVLFSAFGSFYIPVFVLVFVYAKIFRIMRRRNVHRKTRMANTNVALSYAVQVSDEAATAVTLRKSSSNRRRATEPFSGLQVHRTLSPKTAFAEKRTEDPDSPIDCEETDEGTTLNVGRNKKKSSLLLPAVIREENEDEVDLVGSETPSPRPQMRKFAVSEPLQPQCQTMKKRARFLKQQDRKATLTLGLVLGAFIVCWLPFFALYVLSAANVVAPEALFKVAFWLGYCNSALNPVIYTCLNQEFRSAFNRLLCPRSARQRYSHKRVAG